MYNFIEPDAKPSTAMYAVSGILAFISDMAAERKDAFTLSSGALDGFCFLMDGLSRVVHEAGERCDRAEMAERRAGREPKLTEDIPEHDRRPAEDGNRATA